MIQIRTLLLFCISFPGVYGAVTLSASGAQGARNLSKYRVAGPFVMGYTLELRQGFTEKQSQIREFLWNAFRDRSLAHLVVTIYSREGDQTISSFFVEQDENANWRIHIETNRDLGDMRPGHRGERHKESTSYDAYFLKRVDINSPYRKPQYLSDSESLVGTQYELEFQDKDQKRITEF